MNIEHVELHNIGAMETIPGMGENSMVRIPAEIRNKLNERARFVGMDSVGCELRFVTDAPNIDIYVSCSKPEFSDKGEIRIFKGNHRNMVVELEPGKAINIRLNPPDAFANTKKDLLDQEGFSSDVWRVCMNRGGTVCIHGIDTHGHDISPPKAEETPSLKWLAYGSSITNSSLDGYPHVAARILKADVQNKGMSGACHCEKEIADWIAEQCEWDVLTCEMGINMRGGYTPEEFRQRVDYLLRKVTSTHPDKPVIAINVFPNGLTPGYSADTENTATKTEIAYNEIVRELVSQIDSPNLYFIEGSDILSDFTGLSTDLVHPDLYGHAIMGSNLASIMKDILD